jgi:hypothetical protein
LGLFSQMLIRMLSQSYEAQGSVSCSTEPKK